MVEIWGFLDSGFSDAAKNMAIDEVLLNLHSHGKIPPTLRIYGWETPSLSLGKYQKANKIINLDKLKKHGCEVVRRVTGGRSVLHDDEVTYSIVVDENHPNIPTTVEDAYYEISKALVRGYEHLGIAVDLSPKQKLKNVSPVCFEQSAIHELNVNGKKISGNAQARLQGVLLQHGSLPINYNEDMLFDVFNYPNEKLRERQKRNFPQKATSIQALLAYKPAYDELRDAFTAGFKEVFNVEFEEIVLSDEDLFEIELLKRNKYMNLDWHLKKRRDKND